MAQESVNIYIDYIYLNQQYPRSCQGRLLAVLRKLLVVPPQACSALGRGAVLGVGGRNYLTIAKKSGVG